MATIFLFNIIKSIFIYWDLKIIFYKFENINWINSNIIEFVSQLFTLAIISQVFTLANISYNELTQAECFLTVFFFNLSQKQFYPFNLTKSSQSNGHFCTKGNFCTRGPFCTKKLFHRGNFCMRVKEKRKLFTKQKKYVRKISKKTEKKSN